MKVYISATDTDLSAYRRLVRQIAESKGHILLQPSSDSSLNNRYSMIDESHVFIGIYAHRYGKIPAGESQSIIEMEQKRAQSAKKDQLIYIVDPDFDWPEAHKEDDFIKRERLHAFLKQLKGLKPVYFNGQAAVKTHLEKALDPLSEKHDRMDKLRDWSRKLPPERKFAAVEQLTQAYHAQKISRGLFFDATRIISSHFQVQPADINPQLINESEQLLLGNRTFDDYLKAINLSGPLEKLESLIRQHTLLLLVVTAILCLLLGFWLGGRVPNTQQTAMEENANVPSMASAITPIPEISATTTDSTAVDHKREEELPATTTDPPDPVAETTTGMLTLTKDRTAVEETPIENPESNQQAMAEAPVSPATEPDNGQSPEDSVISPPETIHPQVLHFANSLSKDTLTIDHYLARWAAFADTLREPIAKAQATRRLADLKDQRSTRSTLTQPGDLVMCAQVNLDTRMPEVVADTLSIGKVWMWAKLQTRQADTIRAEWIINGRLFHTSTASISVASGAYRIFFSKWHDMAQRGKNELRLKDSDGFLIARRTYWVTDTLSAN